MALQVIGAGLGRKGTVSLKVALEQLGFGRCYHMLEMLGNPGHTALWRDIADGKPDWDTIFDGYGASMDYPAGTCWRELADYYPAAKVVLSVRDPEKWFESVHATIFRPDTTETFNNPDLAGILALMNRVHPDRIAKNSSNFGTMAFGIAATSATFSSSAASFAKGDVLTIIPTSTDASLANLTGTLEGST
jgi:hypothetical protein